MTFGTYAPTLRRSGLSNRGSLDAGEIVGTRVEGKFPSCWQLGSCVIEGLPLGVSLKVMNPVSFT